jgi:hypothetical protein
MPAMRSTRLMLTQFAANQEFQVTTDTTGIPPSTFVNMLSHTALSLHIRDSEHAANDGGAPVTITVSAVLEVIMCIALDIQKITSVNYWGGDGCSGRLCLLPRHATNIPQCCYSSRRAGSSTTAGQFHPHPLQLIAGHKTSYAEIFAVAH